ncbi:DNA-binding NarL/FixJ family response regulator [Paenibacillus phyllosphaerae]|uniref:DNA-binding NarL/FixJ family response regulator n=1 Tax=Paenibacillus phyllosphaerae TaxID=274593 RepID=A0A7W5AZD0_9BACL|nr:response regulator transcription factor [Paenibacillus phyllosphaerae]MBB3111518.1 DNA-binding NarL/FixJ family response regulator [Paenibacillus phyllosphaerae]
MSTPIKVLIVEDDPLICKRYQMILSKDKEIEFVGTAASGYEGTMLAALHKPDIILMDIELEDKQAGLRATSEILTYMPQIKIVMLTVCETDETVFRAFELGATNYLLKNMPAEAIVQAIKDAYYDQPSLHANIAGKITREFKRIKTAEDSLLHNFFILTQLTPTELEVLDLLMKDYTRQEICKLRHVEPSTLKSQINSILKKFNRSSVQEIVPVLRELHIPQILAQRKGKLSLGDG